MLIQVRFTIVVLIMSLYACSYTGTIGLPGLYRVDIQQGNVLDQSMLDRLRPGMDKNQVEFILGTPAFIDPFHTEQWEYFFSIAEDGDDRRQRHLRIHFIDQRLAFIDGDVVVTNRDLSEPNRQSRTVDVPADRQRQEGIFSKMINALPFVGDEPVRRNESRDTSEEPETTEVPETSE